MTGRKAIFVLIAGALVGLLVMGLVFKLIQGDPYRMTVRPAEGGAVVQFAQPGRNLVSPEFPVALTLDAAHSVELRTDAMAIPGCVVEFYDPTLMPGTFKVRVGETLFELTSSGIEVDGRDLRWRQPGP